MGITISRKKELIEQITSVYDRTINKHVVGVHDDVCSDNIGNTDEEIDFLDSLELTITFKEK